MIIGACGFGATGSSIIIDYLEEYGHIQIMGPSEFDWVGQPDGLMDLEYHIKHPHGRYTDSYKAIERYKELCEKKAGLINDFGVPYEKIQDSVENFINAITQTEWFTSYDLLPCRSFFVKIFTIEKK